MSDLKQAVERLERDMEDVCRCGGTLLDSSDLRAALSALSKAEAERDLLAAECRAVRAEGRKQGLEEAAALAEDFCRHVTRLCVPSCEERCPACGAAAAIRALKEKA